MRHLSKIAVLIGALALCLAPAVAAGQPSSVPPDNQGTANAPDQATSHFPAATPGPNASLPAKAKAYGFYCQNESKKHVEGQHGTPFSQCVTAMAKLANGSSDNPRAACATESRKHVEGQHGTPFSQCVSAGAKLQHDQDQSESSG
jgi:hypothetical protein